MNKEALKIELKIHTLIILVDYLTITTGQLLMIWHLCLERLMSNLHLDIVNTKVVKFPANENRQIDREFINSNKFLTGSSNHTIPYRNQQVPVRYDIVDGIKLDILMLLESVFYLQLRKII